MDTETFFADLLISALITFVVILTPFIITRLITHRKIELKTAKKLTIIFSIYSFIVFCFIDFLFQGELASVLPIVIWDIIGYYIIKPSDNKIEIENAEEMLDEKLTDNYIECKPEQQAIIENNTEDLKSIPAKDAHIVKVKAKKPKVTEKKTKIKKSKPSFKTATIILSITTAVFIISTIGLSVGLVIQNKEATKQKENLSYQIENLQNTVSQKQNTINTQNTTIADLKSDLSFYYEYAVCVDGKSQYFHKPDCFLFDNSNFYIYNIEAAKQKGYSRCPYCYD